MTSLAELLRTTTVRWSAAIALALLLQSAVLCGLIYWWIVRHAEASVDHRLVADCTTFAKLGPRDLDAAVNGMVAADLHRSHPAAVSRGQHRGFAARVGGTQGAALCRADTPPTAGSKPRHGARAANFTGVDVARLMQDAA